MKLLKYPLFLLKLLILCIIWNACTDTIEPPVDGQLEYEFFPLEIGKIWEYQLDSTIYDSQVNEVRKTTSYVQEEIVRIESDNVSGEDQYVVSRVWKRNISDRWKPLNLWTASINESQAFRTEDNLRFVKMIFPPREGITWDGNSFIREGINVIIGGQTLDMFKNWNYQITNRIESDSVGDLSFDDVIEVEQANDENAIELRFSKEKYAKNIGLIYKEQRILDTQCIDACIGQTWDEKAQKGFIFTQALINYE